MAASDQLLWQLVKNHNCFQRRSVNNTWLSAEAGNLFNKNSYKFSGLANSSTIDIAGGEGSETVVTVSRPKNARNPVKRTHSTVSKKSFQRNAASIGKVVSSARPDLKASALARLSAIQRAQRKAAAVPSS